MARFLPRWFHRTRRPQQEHGHPLHVRRNVLWAPVCVALLAIPIILACGASPIIISTAPARALTLDITVTDLYPASALVTVQVQTHIAHQAPPYMLSSAHTLTCNGVEIPGAEGTAQVPRQPPGGTYTFNYTDERGQRTTLVVPVPSGRFAVTDPTEGANVALPRQPSLVTTPTAGPSHTPNGPGATSVVSIPLTPTPAGRARDPALVSQPPVVIHFALPTVPSGGTATTQVTAYCGRLGGPLCGIGLLSGPTLAASGTYVLTDAGQPFGSGFETFAPGPGDLLVAFSMTWLAPPSGFSSAHVTVSDQQTIPITWTR